MSSRSYESIPDLELEPARADWSELSHAGIRLFLTKLCNIFHSSPHTSSEGDHRLILYKAALKGDWKAAKRVLSEDESAGCLVITERKERLLHMAVIAKQTQFVRELVKHLEKKELELPNIYGYTAFCYAAISGVVEIAKVMKEKNNDLPTIRDELSPIQLAALMGNKKMVKYLYDNTPLQDFKDEERMNILVATIQSGMYDIALKILNAERSIVTSLDVKKLGSALHALAQKPLPHYDFKRIYGSIQMRRQADQLVKELCTQILTLEGKEIIKLFVETPILPDAAKIGNVEFLTLLIQSYPDLIWIVDSKDKYSIFHVAVINRQEKVFSLIYKTGAIKDLLLLGNDNFGNNILHLAAKLAPASRLNSVSGAALQMQRELLWFKEVEKNIWLSYVQQKNDNLTPRERFTKEHEKLGEAGEDLMKDTATSCMVGPSYVQEHEKLREAGEDWMKKTSYVHEKNKGLTPRELFTKEHEKLRKAGEDWMKDTATSCMVVATLIATVAFAAAFTVPGGNQEETGTPIFLNNRWFTVFTLSDAVAMFSSTASIMMFLSILTSRYREDDFLYTLPAKLMVGLITLFASIVCMVLTFSATFFMVYKEEKEGKLPKIVAGLALLPITLYAMLNCRLLISLIHSTIWASRYMFRPGKHRLF